jgi:hypothetical protein
MRARKGSIVSIMDEDDIVFEQLSHLRTSHPQMPLKHLPLFFFRGRRLDQARRRSLAAAIQQIARRLDKLRTFEWAQHFAENRIDLSVLSDVVHKHLKDLDAAIGSILTRWPAPTRLLDFGERWSRKGQKLS